MDLDLFVQVDNAVSNRLLRLPGWADYSARRSNVISARKLEAFFASVQAAAIWSRSFLISAGNSGCRSRMKTVNKAIPPKKGTETFLMARD